MNIKINHEMLKDFYPPKIKSLSLNKFAEYPSLAIYNKKLINL